QEIKNATSAEEINNLKDLLLSEITNLRNQKSTAAKLNDLLSQAANKNTYQALEALLQQIRELSATQAYKDQQAQINELEIKLQNLDPTKYQAGINQDIEEQLKNNGVQLSDLDPPTQENLKKLKNGEITEPTQVQALKTQVQTQIGKKGAEKELAKLTSAVQTALKSQNKSQIKKVKADLLKFIHSDNIYWQEQKDQAEKLLKDLEKNSLTA
ncbi:10379_t:CDS:1, partial [Ambispora gerdemannii]